MKNFRAIRTAVTLGLIITMMVQPVVAAAVLPGCGSSLCSEMSGDSTECVSCNCCENTPTESGCCCTGPSGLKSGSDDLKAETGHAEIVATDDLTLCSTSALGAYKLSRRALAPVFAEEAAAISVRLIAQRTWTNALVVDVCLCGQKVPPMNRGNDRSSERNNARQLECLVSALPGRAFASTDRLTSPVSFNESIAKPRFSQRQFSVWLI